MIINDAWRKHVVETAWIFVNVLWTPTEKNVYHGYDANGVLVNTPDVNYSSKKYANCGWWQAGRENQGIPYNWGGFCTVEEFQQAIADGAYAGNITDSRDHKRGRQCIGVDCSGLVTACWGLPAKYGTAGLPSVASKLGTTDDLLPGDVLLLPGKHVMIFVAFTDDTKEFAQIIDATKSTGKVSSRVLQMSELLNKGYAGYYYDGK